MLKFVLFECLLALPFLGVFVALTVLTPSWRWVAAFIVIAATPLAVTWVQHWIAIQAPGYNDGPGGFGIFIIGAWSMGFALAVVAYVIGILWWHSRKQPHY